MMQEESPVRTLEKEFSRQVIQQLTVISSLLGGFSFTGLTVLLTITESQFVSSSTFLLTALTTCVLIGASIIGALFSVYHVAGDEKLPAVFGIWFFLVISGIILFFASIILLAFSFKTWVGISCLITVIIVLMLISWAWYRTAMLSDKFGRNA